MKTLLTVFTLASMLSAPAFAEEAPWGAEVDGLQCRLTIEPTVWHVNEEPVFHLELRNTSDTHKVIPMSLCSMVHWPAFVEVVFQVGARTMRLRAGTLMDIESEHPHHPLELAPGQTLSTDVEWRLLEEFQETHEQILEAMQGQLRMRVWAELPFEETVPPGSEVWRRYVPSSFPWEDDHEHPDAQAFQHGWPAWAWKGRLRSNTVNIPL